MFCTIRLILCVSIAMGSACASAPPAGVMGAYRFDDGRIVSVRRSADNTLRYRVFQSGESKRLHPDGTLRYVAGGFSEKKPVRLVVTFDLDDAGAGTAMRFEPVDGAAETAVRVGRGTGARFSSGGVELRGRLDLPDGDGPFPAVIVVHGSGKDPATQFMYNGDFFVSHGIAVLTFDKRGTGRSGGKFTFDFHQLARDVVAAVDYLKTRPEIDAGHIGLSGYSQGGWVAPLAATLSSDVRFVLVSSGLVEVGTATLVVGTEPVFGLGRSTSETKQIVTNRLDVFIDPFQATKDVSQGQDFNARVANAENQNVEWSIEWTAANNVGSFSHMDNDASLTTPANPWTGAIQVKAKSLSNTGLRKDKVDSDPREDTAPVTWSGDLAIKIVPGYKCLGNGEDFTFNTMATIEDYNVIWKRVSGYGSIDQNGRYVAPPTGTTEDVISAEIEGHPEAIDYANIRVGACTCNYVIDIGGASSFHEEGGDVAYLFSDLPEGYHNYQFFFMLNTPESGISMNIGPTDDGPAPRPGEIGIYEASMSYIEPGGAHSWSTLDSTATVLVEILEHTDTYMIANFSGTMAAGDEQNRTTVIVSGSFRAGLWDLGRWPCE